MTNKELREEGNKNCPDVEFLHRVPVQIPQESKDAIADYWLKIIEKRDRELVEKIKEKTLKERGMISLSYADGKKYEVEVESDRMVFYNQALEDIIKLIQRDGE